MSMLKADNGETALALASYAGWPEVVKLLLEAEADVNAKTNNGATPLMLASLKVDARRTSLQREIRAQWHR